MRKYKRGIFIFIAISILSLFFIFFLNDLNFVKIIDGLERFELIYIPLALLFLFLHLWTDGLRVKIIAHAVHSDLKVYEGTKAGLANEFLSALTPMQSGGQPFEVFILHQNGIPLGKCAIISYFRMITSLFFLAVTGFATLVLYPEIYTVGYLIPFYIWGLAYILFIGSLTFLMLFKPRLAKLFSFNTIKLLKKIRLIQKNQYMKNLKYFLSEVEIFNHHIRDIFIRRKIYIFFATIVSFFHWTFKYAVGFVIFLGFLDMVSPEKSFFLQSAIHFINHASPTPGGSGTTELSAYGILKFLDPSNLFEGEAGKSILGSMITLWRLFTYHSIIIIAALLTFNSILSFSKKEKEQEKELQHADYQDYKP